MPMFQTKKKEYAAAGLQAEHNAHLFIGIKNPQTSISLN